MHVDTFEHKRSSERSRSLTSEKKLSKYERERILRQFGVDEKDMKDAEKRAARIRSKRRRSIKMMRFDAFDEGIEDGICKMKSLVPKYSSSVLRSATNSSGSPVRASTSIAMMGAMEDLSTPSLSTGSRGQRKTRGILKSPRMQDDG